MYISIFRLILVILSSMVAGMNIFNILSARANGQSTQVPVWTFIIMLAIIIMMLSTQYFQNKRYNKENKE
ncbi:MAG: hypothetical protein LBL90_11590 [Prevotellaceae bacterium]|nr:hypothetical protein [Prevotellaceae bacterium]